MAKGKKKSKKKPIKARPKISEEAAEAAGEDEAAADDAVEAETAEEQSDEVASKAKDRPKRKKRGDEARLGPAAPVIPPPDEQNATGGIMFVGVIFALLALAIGVQFALGN